MKIKKIIGPGIAAASLALAAWGSVKLYRVTNTTAEATVPATAVKRGDVTFAVYARGEFQGGNSIMLAAPMAGGADMSITFLRSPGELVKSGDTVIQFDTTDQAYALKEAEADLAEAEQKVIQAQAQMQAKQEEDNFLLIKARSDLKQAELEARKNPVVSAIQAKQNDLAVEGARATLDQLSRDLANRKATSQAGVAIQEAVAGKAKVQIETAKKNIEMMTLRAPRDGYVNIQSNTNGNGFYQGMVLPMLQVGDKVRAGMAVAQLPDMKNWEATARIAEADRGHLALHQPVLITAVALPEHPYHGKISDLGGTTGPMWERRFECKISIDDPTPELRPGMTANIVITAETMKNSLWIPAQALFESDGRTYVYARTPEGGFATVDVKLVRRSESQVVITGAKEGTLVALARPDQKKEQEKEKKGGSAAQAITK
ncbi:MAG TPA: HlyD family efflux transporter periplasmic adaptor subunit [Bryobacteraceae bacterium]|jgi:HlyD family secretion protein|nr:HlyD family efflux transporter periplasmic adaptor subunit [Bryobacteraceae bacterium]